MINENIKKQILDELKPVMKNVNLDICLELLWDILESDYPIKELQGIKVRYPQAIKSIFDQNSSYSKIIESISTLFKVEPVFKLLLYLVNEVEYQRVLSENKGFSVVIKLLGLNPQNVNLNKPQSYYFGQGNYIEQIAMTYKLRNMEAHTCETWGRRELYSNIDSVLITLLYCVNLKKKILMEKVQRNKSKDVDVSEYMEELVLYFRNKMKKFVSLNGEENLQIVDRFVSENIENENDVNEIKGRCGTIDELRNGGVPEGSMVVWGEAGTGKSTTLEYLAFIDAQKRLKDKESKIPVLIPLGLLVSKDISLKEYILNKLKLSEILLEDLLKDGQINIFLDGVNEIPNDNHNQLKNIRLREIRELMKNYEKCFIIISNRPNDSRDFTHVPIFNLVKFSNEQIELFLKKNAENTNTISIITSAVSQNKRLKEVVRTPLMFSRLIDIVDATGKVPTSEGTIIGAFLDTLLNREKAEKLDANFDIKKAKYLLRAIAYNGLEDTSTNAGIPEETVLSYMQKCMNTYSFAIDSFYMLDMMVQLGILIRRDGLYLFTHQAYQDYYYALEEMAILGL